MDVSEFLQDPAIKQDVVRLIAQYLQEEGFDATTTILQDEANIKLLEKRSEMAQFKRFKVAILEGQWEEVVLKCKQFFKLPSGKIKQDPRHSFVYAVHKQRYLEQLERREIQQAFTYLTKRLKFFEPILPIEEMKDLCYVLTCRAVQDAPSFCNWQGTAHRRLLVEQLELLLEFERPTSEVEQNIPPNRLHTLLSQALTHQIGLTKTTVEGPLNPKSSSLMSDFHAPGFPDTLKHVFRGHTANIKCISLVGEDMLLSGSSDCTVKLWNLRTEALVKDFVGHTARIWDMCSDASGETICSASADSTVKLWSAATGLNTETLSFHSGDVYSVDMHPGGTHIVTGGYDKSVRLIDVRVGQEVNQFKGHSLGVSGVTFNQPGNLIFSGSKDSSVRVWDIASGLCVKTLLGEFAQVSSIDLDHNTGTSLLVATKSNTNAIVDLRMDRIVKRFRGHQNTSKHFIRASFGPFKDQVMGGSEDGAVSIWDINSGEITHRLQAHEDLVYQALWNPALGLLATCSDDQTIRTWRPAQSAPA